MFGPLFAGLGAALADFMGAMIFGTGLYFPGFTATAFLAGLMYGLFLYKHPKSLPRAFVAVAIVTIFIQMGIETVWLTMLFDRGFIALMPVRLVRTAIMLPLQIICIRIITQERLMRHIMPFREIVHVKVEKERLRDESD